MLVVLKMNKGFMKYMRHKHGLAVSIPDFNAAGLLLVMADDDDKITAEKTASATLASAMICIDKLLLWETVSCDFTCNHLWVCGNKIKHTHKKIIVRIVWEEEVY